jgi:Glycogen recognition site of AMP-activated protein kinase
MTHRIDDYLDGRLERIALSPDERTDADALVRAIEETRTFVDGTPVPDVTATVMRRVREIGAPQPRYRNILSGIAASVWTRREVSFGFRPAYAIAVAVAVWLVLPAALLRLGPVRSPFQTVATDSPKLLVQFRLQAADAMTVRLAGSFSNWQSQYDLHQTSPGIWTITLPLPRGVYDYAFVIDGQHWVADPYAQAVDDGFGGTNSRIAILPPDQSRS